MEKENSLKILRDLHNKALFSERTALETFIPELKELEDEKTRKEIINYLKKNCRLEWAAWLEKQGEQKVSVVEFNAKEKNSTNIARKLEIEKAAMSATGIIDREEWFIKGAKWADENPAYISSEKQGEQKPGWSEEDQNALEDVREAVVHYWGGETQDILLYWLKSLKQRIAP